MKKKKCMLRCSKMTILNLLKVLVDKMVISIAVECVKCFNVTI